MKGRGAGMIASWAFLIGFFLAVGLGLFNALSSAMIMVLAIIGIIVGLLNVTEREVTPFLMSGAVLIIASALGQGIMQAVVLNNVHFASNVLDALLALFVPATIIVAVKHVFDLAKN
jgi:uncharacterized membrane protein